MALTTSDVNAVLAQWEEWTADSGYELTVKVSSGEPDATMLGVGARQFGARLTSDPYVRVQIRRGDQLVVNERYPCDADGLKASITVLARAVAAQHLS